MRILSLVRLVPVVVTLAAWLGTAGPAAACSCVQADMRDARQHPDQVIFTGTVAPRAGSSVPVIVERWFHGTGAAPVVRLDAHAFSDDGGGADCRAGWLDEGVAYFIWGYRPPDGDLIGVNICLPHAPLADPQGQALLREAERFLGPGIDVRSEADPAESSPPPNPAAWLLPAAIVSAGAATIALIAVAAAVTGRRRQS